MQPERPIDYDKLDHGKPFKASVGELTEEQMKAAARKDCRRCWGTGREGFMGGVAIVCRCVKKKQFPLEPAHAALAPTTLKED